MRKYRLSSTILLLLAFSFLFGACASDEPIKIETPDSVGIIQNESESATAVQDITTSVQVTTTETATETTTASEPTTENSETVTDKFSEETTVSAEVKTTIQEEQNKEPEGQTVYITPSGKRYHLSSTCGGKNSYSVSINDAGNRTPCKKCAQ